MSARNGGSAPETRRAGNAQPTGDPSAPVCREHEEETAAAGDHGASTHPELMAAARRFAARAERCRSTTGGAAAALGPELRRMLRRIAATPEIRFFVDGTRNFGHQASTVTIMARLIRLTRYRGHVRVIWADYRDPYLGCTAAKLALLIPGLDPRRLDTARVTIGTCRNVTFLPLERQRALRTRADFGFTGGADDMAVDLARALNVRWFCRIQPYLWDDGPERKDDAYYESSRIEAHDGRRLYLVDAWPPYRSLVVKADGPPQPSVRARTWTWYGERQRFDPGLAVRTRNARALDEALEKRPDARIWPVYGLHHFHDAAPDILCNILRESHAAVAAYIPTVPAAADHERSRLPHAALAANADASPLANGARRKATLCGPGSNAGRERDGPGPIIVVSFTPEEEVLASRGFGPAVAAHAEAIGTATDRPILVAGYDPFRREYVDATPAIRAAVRDAAPSNVVVVLLGMQPPEVFDSCYRRADLPGIIEGQATASRLLSNGIPFLQLVREEHAFDSGYPTCVPGYDGTVAVQWLDALARGLRDRRGRTAAVMSDARTPRLPLALPAAVREYFHRMGDYFGQDSHDKFVHGLLALSQVTGAQP